MKKLLCVIAALICFAYQPCLARPLPQASNEGAILNDSQQAKEKCKEILGSKDKLVKIGQITCYSGTIPEGKDKKKLMLYLRQSKFFVVRSMGGDVDAAIDVAKVLSAGNKTVIVLGNCLSSCANYWFLGARYKVAGADDAVGFHGGPPITIDCADEKIDCVSLARIFYRSRDFLRDKGIDYHILYTPPNGYDVNNRQNVLWIFPKSELINKWKVTGILQYDIDNS